MKTNIQKKTKLVNYVFSKVHKKYDLMNDIMSFGVHRVWKNELIDWMKPQHGQKLVDVASGTGDIVKLFLNKNDKLAQIDCVEPNEDMFNFGKERFKNEKNVKWFNQYAESLPFEEDSYDFYTISFGIRNVGNINKALSEAFRVLKPGGRFMCLEFSKVDNEIFNFIYQNYSKLIPHIGKYIVGTSQPYDYLIKSIKEFHSQAELLKLMENNKFSNIEYRNLSNGICAIHSGWKI